MNTPGARCRGNHSSAAAEAVVAGADGGQVVIAAAFHEITRISHAVLHRDAAFAAGAGHLTDEGFAGINGGTELRRIVVDAVQPVLFIGHNAAGIHVAGNVIPPFGVHGGHAGNFVFFVIGAGGINPAVVRRPAAGRWTSEIRPARLGTETDAPCIRATRRSGSIRPPATWAVWFCRWLPPASVNVLKYHQLSNCRQ